MSLIFLVWKIVSFGSFIRCMYNKYFPPVFFFIPLMMSFDKQKFFILMRSKLSIFYSPCFWRMRALITEQEALPTLGINHNTTEVGYRIHSSLYDTFEVSVQWVASMCHSSGLHEIRANIIRGFYERVSRWVKRQIHEKKAYSLALFSLENWYGDLLFGAARTILWPLKEKWPKESGCH